MFDSAAQDGALRATVQDSPLRSTRPRSAFMDTLDALDAALDADDVAALQALVPGLRKADGHSLLHHHKQQAWRLQMGQRDYGMETWGQTPPLRLLRGTLAVRVAALQAWHPEMSAKDVRHIVTVNMGDELARGQFWRLPITTLNVSDERGPRALSQGRRFALHQELLAHFAADLKRIHAVTVEMLDDAGLSWELLVSHAAGTAACAGAVGRCAECEAEDLRVFSAYLPESLRG